MRQQDFVTFDQNGKRLRTYLFGIPQSFYRALSQDLGRPGDLATDAEVEEYIRDVVNQNIQHVIDSQTPKPRLRAKKAKPRLTARRAHP